jgi:hypothetical protein
MKKAFLLLLILTAAACSSKPVLMKNCVETSADSLWICEKY